jgi:cupin 2 domain-containing protein
MAAEWAVPAHLQLAGAQRRRRMTAVANLLAHIPAVLPDELYETLLDAGTLRIERIVSRGHASPPGFWYDQPWHEWVVVLQGEATLRFEGEDAPVALRPGDYVHIPARRRHRVEWTTPREPTIWLAIHYANPGG